MNIRCQTVPNVCLFIIGTLFVGVSDGPPEREYLPEIVSVTIIRAAITSDHRK